MESEDFLRQVELFKHLNKAALESLSSQMRLVCLPEGHVIRDTVRDRAPVDGPLHSQVGCSESNQGVTELGS